MTTPRPTHFPTTTPRARVLIPFVIICDSDDEITTLPVRPAPPSSDRIPAWPGYLLDFGDDTSDEYLSETPCFCPSTGKGDPDITSISLPSSSSPPPSLLSLSSSPPPSLLPPSSCKRPRSPSLSPPSAVLPPSPEVFIPETLDTTAPARLRRMVKAHRWSFARDGIDTWRHQEGEPKYETGESSSAQIHPITSEPIHRTIHLLVAILVRHDDQIEEIRYHQREILTD
ncbi:hypothetical protein Tco_1036930 [Tanacetum coccineum]